MLFWTMSRILKYSRIIIQSIFAFNYMYIYTLMQDIIIFFIFI